MPSCNYQINESRSQITRDRFRCPMSCSHRFSHRPMSWDRCISIRLSFLCERVSRRTRPRLRVRTEPRRGCFKQGRTGVQILRPAAHHDCREACVYGAGEVSVAWCIIACEGTVSLCIEVLCTSLTPRGPLPFTKSFHRGRG